MDSSWLSYSVRTEAPSVSSAKALSVTFRPGKERTFADRDRLPSQEGSSTKGQLSGVADTRLLFASLSGEEIDRRVSASDRCFEAQSTHLLPPFSNGDSQKCPSVRPSGRLEFFSRSDGRLSPCPASTFVSEIPEVCHFVVGGILFYGSPFRPEHSTAGFHANCYSCSSSPSRAGEPFTRIPGRLAFSVTGSPGPGGFDSQSSESSRFFGFQSELEEVQSDSVPGVPVLGPLLQHSHLHCPAGRSPPTEGVSRHRPDLVSLEHYPKSANGVHRSAQRGGRFCSSRSSLPSPDPVLATPALDSAGGGPRRVSPSRSGAPICRRKMVRFTLPTSRCSSLPTHSHQDPVHGLVPAAVGGTPREFDRIRSLEPKRETVSHQRLRADEHSEVFDPLSSSSTLSRCPSPNRQFHLCLLPEEAGGNEILSLDGSDVGNFPTPGPGGNFLSSQTHSFFEERSCRCAVSHPSVSDRVVTQQESLSRSARISTELECGSLRHAPEYSVGNVRVPISRPEGCRSGCSVNSLEFSGHSLCVSTAQVASCISRQGQAGTTSAHSGSSSTLASPIVVHGCSPAVSIQCAPASAAIQSVSSGRETAPQARRVDTPRMDVIRSSLTAVGYSDAVADRVARSGRTSTNTVYDAKWKIFSDWCATKQIDPLDPSGPQLADFFVFLFVDRKLCPSTLRGYRASIVSVLCALRKLPVDTEIVLNRLFQSFNRDRPVSASTLPTWDLGIVLQGLMRPPFEPLREASFRLLSLKTLFLVSLASGARRGEILALVRTGLRFDDDGSSAIIYPDPQFVPKSKRGVSSNRPLVLRSLKGHTQDSKDRFLCPVRCLRRYVKKSADHRLLRNSHKLFLPLDETSLTELSSHSHKSLILSVIEEGYRAMDLDLPREFSLRMHDLRKLSFSVASASGVTLEAILSAGRWKHQSTFTRFYLRSMALSADNLFALGPLSLPGSVVQPGSHRLDRS